ncbi:metallophosphoesterase family protein [Parvularcula bermudensis]|nr:metallophosphoesterase [Parvularcula bermudensis]
MTPPLRLVQMADLHFGAENKSALEAVKDILPSLGVDAVIVAGDMTQKGRREEFDAASTWLSDLGPPVLGVPGNHDTPLLNMVDRVKAPFKRYEDRLGWLPSSSSLKGAALFGLNTARGWQARRNWAEGSVNLDQLGGAIEYAHAHDGWGAVLFCHHPFLSPPKAPLRIATRRGQRASEQLSKSPYTLLLAGHVHVPRAQIEGDGHHTYLSVTCGTLSTRLRDGPASFNVVDLSPDAVEITAHRFETDSGFAPCSMGRWAIKGGSVHPH